MTATDWAVTTQQFKDDVASIEQAAAEGKIPLEALRELKSVVDECRTNLWAALATLRGGKQESTSLILSTRLQRVQEMCDLVRSDVTEGRLLKDIPDLGKFIATLGETERCVRSLVEQTIKAESAGSE